MPQTTPKTSADEYYDLGEEYYKASCAILSKGKTESATDEGMANRCDKEPIVIGRLKLNHNLIEELEQFHQTQKRDKESFVLKNGDKYGHTLAPPYTFQELKDWECAGKISPRRAPILIYYITHFSRELIFDYPRIVLWDDENFIFYDVDQFWNYKPNNEFDMIDYEGEGIGFEQASDK